MRVFYVDEEEVFKRRYYVKVDNVDVPEELKVCKAIDAGSIEELKESIKVLYGFNRHKNYSLELWSGQNYMGKRVDILEEIPKEIEFIWARVVLNKM